MKNIESFLKSEETYNKVLNILNSYTDVSKLNKSEFIAGGSISNIIISMVHGGKPVINDIDVYQQIQIDSNTGIELAEVKETQWYPSISFFENHLELFDDQYGRVFVDGYGSKLRVVKHFRKGIINYVNYVYENKYNNDVQKDKKQIIIEGFDLNCCKAGLDLEEGKLIYTPEFVDYLKTKQLKVVNPCAPIQTGIRLFKKINDLKCFCDIEHEMRFLTVAAKNLYGNQVSKVIGTETKVKYDAHKDLIEKYFILCEPTLDELPYDVRKKYEKDGVINPDMPKVWMYKPVINFNIPELVTDVNSLKRVWELLYTYRGKQEQNKINKIFYKNVYLGNVKEDTWEINEYIRTNDSSEYSTEYVKKTRYSSNRFTHQMIMVNKNYHKCNFDLKHVDVIDKFTDEHYSIRPLLKKSSTLAEQYKLIKFIKKLARKEGNWVIGILETLNRKKYEDVLKGGLTEEVIQEIIIKEKEFNSKELVEKIDLSNFEYKDCIQELNTTLELKAEGSKMGHCVGGYSGSISSGFSRIFHVDCDGIGSTVQIRIPLTRKTIYGKDGQKEFNIVEVYHPEDFSECIIIYDDNSIKKESVRNYVFGVSQHFGRYPEKGNKQPTETNKKIVKSLVDYLNRNHLPKNYKINLENLAKDKNNSIFVEGNINELPF